MGQFLTAVFEMRPTRRKAAALERVRAKAEDVFWDVMAKSRPSADAAVEEADRKLRRTAIRKTGALTRSTASAARLCEPVRQGLARDVEMAVGSYIELRVKKHEAEWPQQPTEAAADRAAGYAALAASTTKDDEDAARDQISRVDRLPGPRPLTLARERDARIVRRDQHGSIAAVLYALDAADKNAMPATIHEGLNASTGEVVKASKSRTRIVVPLSCSKWHEHKFLSGRATLRSSLVIRRGDRWFLQSQFEMPEVPKIEGEARLGIDRGIVNTLATAVVRLDGSVLAKPVVSGSSVSHEIRRAEEQARAYQRRTARSGAMHRRHVDHLLHEMTNRIVATAKSYRAQVVVERLDEFKAAITTKRQKGTRKGGWRRILKRAQLGKAETMLEYKLALAGLPPLRAVPAAGTSTTCTRCGHRASENRPAQDIFKCIGCGFEANADENAAVQIARRGAMTVKKGDKLIDLHMNMVAVLRDRDDGGLGPLAASVAGGFVAAHAAGPPANALATARSAGPTEGSGQDVTSRSQNTREGVFAERAAGFLEGVEAPKSVVDQGLRPDQVRRPSQ